MGKRSVTLDWQSGDGVCRHFMRLVASSDILIEDWSAESRSDIGIDSVLAEQSGTNSPLTHPVRHRMDRTLGGGATPLVSLALGGFLYLSGDEDREPLMIPGYQSEYLAGLQGYSGVMIALWKRTATGAWRQSRGLRDRVAWPRCTSSRQSCTRTVDSCEAGTVRDGRTRAPTGDIRSRFFRARTATWHSPSPLKDNGRHSVSRCSDAPSCLRSLDSRRLSRDVSMPMRSTPSSSTG